MIYYGHIDIEFLSQNKIKDWLVTLIYTCPWPSPSIPDRDDTGGGWVMGKGPGEGLLGVLQTVRGPECEAILPSTPQTQPTLRIPQ